MKETETVDTAYLKELVRSGHQYAIVPSEALDIAIPLSKMEVREDDVVTRYLSLNEVSELLGSDFVPRVKFNNHVLIHWCFDELLSDGKTEQAMIKELLEAYGFVNMRDLDGDGLNDSLAEDIDCDLIKSNLDARYYGLFSQREVKFVKFDVAEEL